MYSRKALFFGLASLATLGLATPIREHSPSVVRHEPNLVKRIDLGPSAYPFGTAYSNEFVWHGWNSQDSTQQADGSKLHDQAADAQIMMSLAYAEALSVSDTFKRWFDEGDADKVRAVFERIINPDDGTFTTLMPGASLQYDDFGQLCARTDVDTYAYMSMSRGRFHICPRTIALPKAVDLQCSDLDSYASLKMYNPAFVMVHEFTHWNQVGYVALGSEIIDHAAGASDCFNLAAADKLTNANNYALLAAEAYFMAKGCTFNDPPPGTTSDQAVDAYNISPETYTGGWCGMHVTQYQKNEPGDCSQCESPDYILSVCIYDANGMLLNPLGGYTLNDDPIYADQSPTECGQFVALNGVAQIIDTALPRLMYVTVGAVDDDPVSFTYGDQDWDSNNQEHSSNFGSYDSGSRQGDTGFSC